MRTQIPVPLMYPVLYIVVLAAGLYSGAVGASDTNFIPFIAGLAALAAVDVVEWRTFPAGAPLAIATGLLAARGALYALVVAADPSGVARVLLLLLPFRAYFIFGRVVAVSLSAALVMVTVLTFQLADKTWTTDPEQIADVVMFIVGLVLALVMAAVSVEERLGRERLRRASAAAERSRIGGEIHDGLGHHLTAISVLLEKAAAFREIDPATANAAISDAQQSSRLALKDVRRSVRTLDEREPFDLAEALSELNHGLPVELQVSGDVASYDDERRLVLYRAAQEGITNALRHASAARIDVQVELGPQTGTVTVRDDGQGFPPGELGWGLTAMRERVVAVGGDMHVDSRPGRGTRLTVRVPRVSQ